ncbi:uncharacterized protein LOC102506755 isoform X2 [Camelus ferus]|uniref:Uncharacterized protein LOC102506755 isoform X2 n=1 Tax=Camelus ferus TaxID=419612 RepID=A0A8B8TFC6_CAMFR|nr:uncharacterized protein LOC102506755 isoform X2 [Camelus ferus]
MMCVLHRKWKTAAAPCEHRFPEVVHEFLWRELASWKTKTVGMQFFDMRITGSVKTIMPMRTLNHSDHFILVKLAIKLCSS